MMRIGGTSVLVAILVVLLFVVSVRRPYRKAEMIRARIESNDWQRSDKAAIRQFVQEFGGTFKCEKDWCEGEIHSSNRVLSLLYLAPPMDFRALIHLTSNCVSNVSLTLTNVGSGASSIFVAKSFDSNGLGLDGRDYVVDKGVKHSVPFVAVRISLKATKEQLRSFDSLDLKCLTRLKGCSEQQLGPEIWKSGS